MKPNKDEKHGDFMGRCMEDKMMCKNHPEDGPRKSMCQTMWDDENDEKESKGGSVMSLKESIDRVNKSIQNAEEVAKKLTTKDRKKLQKSTFCGPNRSFPVPDCKHVGTAKAYLNRSNFTPEQKARIASCINRKAKSLGCTPGKPAKAKGAVEEFTFETLPPEMKVLADSEIFKTTKDLVEDSIKNPGKELDFTGCEDCE